MLPKGSKLSMGRMPFHEAGITQGKVYRWLTACGILCTIVQTQNNPTALMCPASCSCVARSDGLLNITCRDSPLTKGAFVHLHSIGHLSVSGVQGIIPTGAFDGLSGRQNTSMITINHSSGNIVRVESGAFRNIENFLRVEFSHNNIDAFAQDAFLNIQGVSEVSFRFCNIQKLEAFSLRGLQNLERIDIVNCAIGTVRSFAFAGISDVDQFTIQLTEIAVLETESFGGVENVNKLQFFDCALTHVQKYAFGFTNVAMLTFDITEFEYLGPQAFGRTQNVKMLELDISAVTFMDNFVFHGLENIGKLRWLWVDVMCMCHHAFWGLSGTNTVSMDENAVFPIKPSFNSQLSPLDELNTEYSCLPQYNTESFLTWAGKPYTSRFTDSQILQSTVQFMC